jgi:hypothetical protein
LPRQHRQTSPFIIEAMARERSSGKGSCGVVRNLTPERDKQRLKKAAKR